MTSKIFANIPVKDLRKSMDFFKELGFTFDMKFTNTDAACMIVGEGHYVMLLTEAYFKTFTGKEIPDTSKTAQVILALAVESRDEVKEVVGKAFAAGASEYAAPKDYGFMYQESFADPDGHLWEIFYMDVEAQPADPAAA